MEIKTEEKDGAIQSISIISPGTGYTGKPALSKIWAMKLGIWDEEYEEQMLKNHPDIYHYFDHTTEQ